MPTKAVACLIGFILLLTIAHSSLAQDGAQTRPQRVQETAESIPETLINVDFKGGNAADYVQAIRAAAPSTNIVVMNDITAIRMPATQLRSVTAWSALQVLSAITSDQNGSMVEMRVERQGSSRAPGSRSNAEPVYVIAARIIGPGGNPVTRDLAVLEISQIIQASKKPEEVLSIVESALEMFRDDYQPADIRFHEGTGILIVRGHRDQVSAVQRVMKELKDKHSRQDSSLANQQQHAESLDRLAKLEASLTQAQQMVETLTRQVTEWRTRSEVLQEEIQITKRRFDQQEAEFRERVRDLQKELADSNRPTKPQ